MLHAVFGSGAGILPALRPCDTAERQRCRHAVIVIATVLLFVVLAIRGEDLTTVLGTGTTLMVTSAVLVRLGMLTPSATVNDQATGPRT